MKVNLMFEDNNFASQLKFHRSSSSFSQDLELDTLCKSMSLGDEFLYKKAMSALTSGLNNNLKVILYRQEVLKDCIKNSSFVREIYKIALEANECKKKHWWISSSKYPSSILSNAVYTLKDLVTFLYQIKKIASENSDKFTSIGFKVLFDILKKELDDDYFSTLQNHLVKLEFLNGIFFSAKLTKCNKGAHYILREDTPKKNFVQRFFEKKAPEYSFSISERDIAGTKALGELKDEAINSIANTLAQSSDHVINFFNKLQDELAFYISCLNLFEQLTKIEAPVAFPIPIEQKQHKHTFINLYDICLALTMNKKIVGNDLCLDNSNLVIITGANQGGKSTFLRSIGLSQLMMQCGMFVPAESFTANICNSIFTHFKREEDKAMNSGKLDEELKRFDEMVDHINADSLVLFNESFAATNEREGSEVATQIVSALFEKGIKVYFVTHLFEFANNFFTKTIDGIVFLRANRQADGTRTYKLVQAEPLQTSFGEDLYNKIFKF